MSGKVISPVQFICCSIWQAVFGVLWTFLFAVGVLGLVFCVGCFCVFMPLPPPSSLVLVLIVAGQLTASHGIQ